MPTLTTHKSGAAELLERAVEELERSGARTPLAVRKVMARVARDSISLFPPAKAHEFLGAIARGFEDARSDVSEAAVSPDSQIARVSVGRGASNAERQVTQTPSINKHRASETFSSKTMSRHSVEEDAFHEAMTSRLKFAKQGKLLEFAQFQERAGLSRQAIYKQLRTGSLFMVDGPDGVNYYPWFFVDTRYDIAIVRRVARALKGLPGGTKWVFFTHPRHTLNGLTPLDIIAKAKPSRNDAGRSKSQSASLDAVLRAAAAEVEG